MASLGLGLFLGGSVVAIPVVTGIAEGVEHQKKQNEEAANETRMTKFNALVTCDSKAEFADEVDKGIVVLRHNKVRLTLAAPLTPLPTPRMLPRLVTTSGLLTDTDYKGLDSSTRQKSEARARAPARSATTCFCWLLYTVSRR